MAMRPGSLRELLLREGVLHEAHRAVRVELLAVARDDAGRLLPAVLERVQAEVRHVGRLGVAEDAEDAALVVKVIVFVERDRARGAAGRQTAAEGRERRGGALGRSSARGT